MIDPEPRPVSIFSPAVVKRFLLVFLSVSLCLGAVVAVVYFQDLANDRAVYQQEGAHLVDLHAEIVSREFDSIKSDLLYLAQQTMLREFLSGDGVTKDQINREYVLFCAEKKIYDQIRFLDAEGNEVIRVNDNNGQPAAVPESELQEKAGRYYFRDAIGLGPGVVFVSPFDLNVEHDKIERPLKPMIRFATPVFDRRGVKRGIVVLNYLGARLIGELEEVAANFSGSVLLLNREGYYLKGPRPEDEWGFMFGTQRAFGKDHPEAWRRLVGEEEGQFFNGEGLFTFAAVPRPQASAPPKAGDWNPPPEALNVVAVVPNEVLYARSAQLLGRLLLVSVLGGALLLVLVWYLAYSNCVRRQHELRIEQSENRLRHLSTQLLTAQEDERRHMSRDLHDDLGQLVTAVTVDLQRARRLENGQKKAALLDRALGGTQRLLDRVQDISSRLRPTVLDDLGLKDAVQSYLSEFEFRSGLVTRANLRFERDDIPRSVSENVYRILQEALNNVLKHAEVSEVRVDLHAAPDAIALQVQDSGRGFEPEEVDGTRLGILGMRERVELLGGTFRLTSQRGTGTEIRVTIPLTSAYTSRAGDGAKRDEDASDELETETRST